MSALLDKGERVTSSLRVSTKTDDAIKIANDGIIVTKLCGGCITKQHKVKVQLVEVKAGDAYTKFELRWKSGMKKGWKTSTIDLKSDDEAAFVSCSQSSDKFSRNPQLHDKKDLSAVFSYSEGSIPKNFSVVFEKLEDLENMKRAFASVMTKLKTIDENRSPDEKKLLQLFISADTGAQPSGTLDKDEVINVVSQLNVDLTKQQIRKKFEEVDVNNDGVLTFDEFVKFMDALRSKPELEFLWDCLCDKNNADWNTFDGFARNVAANKVYKAKHKGDTLSLSDFQAAWTKYQTGTPFPNIVDDDITYIKFAHAMKDAKNNNLFAPEKATLYQDMTLPLPHYFMASSHNTYLEGNQLDSAATTNAYIKALLTGCRCVELDCWDGGKDKEPIITHGGTLTSTVLFKDVIQAIKDYGFKTSPYPVVLSIENHCSPEFQNIMVNHLTSILGEILELPPASGYPGDVYPSPEALRNKVLLKGNRLSPSTATELIEEVSSDEEDEEKEGKEVDGLLSANDKKHSQKHHLSKSDKSSVKNVKAKKVKPLKVIQELSDITAMMAKKVKTFDPYPDLSNNIAAGIISSFEETKTMKRVKKPEELQKWIYHNRRHMSRIYPNGFRISSSNYNPVAGWTAGNQVVALNYQTPDEAMQINLGKFRENGSCGYVLKPAYMLDDIAAPSPACQLTLRIISGNRLPKPRGDKTGEIVDPYVHVQVHGEVGDHHVAETKVINNNGFNPVWNQEMKFTISNPDIAMITFSVMEKDLASSEFIASESLPFTCLQQGFRVVTLRDGYGNKPDWLDFASLFVHAQISQSSATLPTHTKVATATAPSTTPHRSMNQAVLETD